MCVHTGVYIHILVIMYIFMFIYILVYIFNIDWYRNIYLFMCNWYTYKMIYMYQFSMRWNQETGKGRIENNMGKLSLIL